MTSRSCFDDPACFGEMWAGDYDDLTDSDPDPAVDFLAGLADGGRALGLAIGTGRVGVPPAARGVRVEGAEASEQRFLSQKITIDAAGVRLRPHAECYSWPAELDPVAAQAGLRPAERHADRSRRPYGSESTGHVPVYRPI